MTRTPHQADDDATHIDLTIIAGRYLDIEFPVLDETGADVDVTGWSATAQARREPGRDVVLHEWSTELGTLLPDGNTVRMTATSTATAEWAQWVGLTAGYDLVLHQPGTDPERLHPIARGRITVLRPFTRTT